MSMHRIFGCIYICFFVQPARSESGAYLFIRTPKDAMFDIKRSFQRHKSILKMSGHLKGIATPDKVY